MPTCPSGCRLLFGRRYRAVVSQCSDKRGGRDAHRLEGCRQQICSIDTCSQCSLTYFFLLKRPCSASLFQCRLRCQLRLHPHLPTLPSTTSILHTPLATDDTRVDISL